MEESEIETESERQWNGRQLEQRLNNEAEGDRVEEKTVRKRCTISSAVNVISFSNSIETRAAQPRKLARSRRKTRGFSQPRIGAFISIIPFVGPFRKGER